ncbi:MAG: Lrp/AsnC family transcriptional regulator [Tepidiformaceae bacterium]
MTSLVVPVEIEDPVNRAILAISEDRIQGFVRDPFAEVAARSGIDVGTVIERVQAMLDAGVIRRVRQTLLATNLAPGALVAWEVPTERLHAAFDYLFEDDPFSGHVVIRTTDGDTPGSRYRLWTTLKVPQEFSMERHADHLAAQIEAKSYRLMPARCLFVLGVGHTRRRDVEPGSRSEAPADVNFPTITQLTAHEWRILEALKRDFSSSEITTDPWRARAEEAEVPLEEFCQVAEALDERRVIGRFSTFLEHVKPLPTGERVTRYNALFHWAVPVGRELEAGREVGRHHILTHAYWREGGPEFGNVNVMAVAHGMDKDLLLRHKEAIDSHLQSSGIAVGYTNVFWGGRSEIKPSEISPVAYLEWCLACGIDPDSMREGVGR